MQFSMLSYFPLFCSGLPLMLSLFAKALIFSKFGLLIPLRITLITTGLSQDHCFLERFLLLLLIHTGVCINPAELC